MVRRNPSTSRTYRILYLTNVKSLAPSKAGCSFRCHVIGPASGFSMRLGFPASFDLGLDCTCGCKSGVLEIISHKLCPSFSLS